jgi:hypothetical protein
LDSSGSKDFCLNVILVLPCELVHMPSLALFGSSIHFANSMEYDPRQPWVRLLGASVAQASQFDLSSLDFFLTLSSRLIFVDPFNDVLCILEL